jgi:hypothetical protein
MNHIIIALVMQAVPGLLLGNWWLGAAIGAWFFVGREIAQAEYRGIVGYYGGKRANAPWWVGFEPRAWNAKAVGDFAIPCAAVVLVALLA